jgi:hypothetical protein
VHIWSRPLSAIDGFGMFMSRVAVDAAGDWYASGYTFAGDIDFEDGNGPVPPVGGEDSVLVKFDGATGATLWAKRFGAIASYGQLSIDGMAVASDHDVIITGAFNGAATFGGPTIEGGGDTVSTAYVAKLDGSTGDHLWSVGWTDDTSLESRRVAVDGDCGVYIAGSMSSSYDFGPGQWASAGADAFVLELAPP